MAQTDYETLFILKPDLSEEEIDAEISKLNAAVEANNGSIIEEDRLGKRRLAYPIKKQRYGFYSLLRFTLDSGSISEIEKVFRFNENYLKNIILIFDAAAGRNLNPEETSTEEKKETPTEVKKESSAEEKKETVKEDG